MKTECHVCKQCTSSWERFDYPESLKYRKDDITDPIFVCPTCIRQRRALKNIDTDLRVYLTVHRDALAEAGLLEEYIAQRGDRFNAEGNDRIALSQARLLGLLDLTKYVL